MHVQREKSTLKTWRVQQLLQEITVLCGRTFYLRENLWTCRISEVEETSKGKTTSHFPGILDLHFEYSCATHDSANSARGCSPRRALLRGAPQRASEPPAAPRHAQLPLQLRTCRWEGSWARLCWLIRAGKLKIFTIFHLHLTCGYREWAATFYNHIFNEWDRNGDCVLYKNLTWEAAFRNQLLLTTMLMDGNKSCNKLSELPLVCCILIGFTAHNHYKNTFLENTRILVIVKIQVSTAPLHIHITCPVTSCAMLPCLWRIKI